MTPLTMLLITFAAVAIFGHYWHRVETFEDALAVFGISTDRPPF